MRCSWRSVVPLRNVAFQSCANLYVSNFSPILLSLALIHLLPNRIECTPRNWFVLVTQHSGQHTGRANNNFLLVMAALSSHTLPRGMRSPLMLLIPKSPLSFLTLKMLPCSVLLLCYGQSPSPVVLGVDCAFLYAIERTASFLVYLPSLILC